MPFLVPISFLCLVSKAHVCGTPLFVALARAAEQYVGELKPGELAINAWAFATIGHRVDGKQSARMCVKKDIKSATKDV